MTPNAGDSHPPGCESLLSDAPVHQLPPAMLQGSSMIESHPESSLPISSVPTKDFIFIGRILRCSRVALRELLIANINAPSIMIDAEKHLYR
jgi:hypothetical protein